MSDLISILSEIRSSYNCFDEKEEPYYRALGEAIRLVSAQPEKRTEERAKTHACDSISRQAAIDAIEKAKTARTEDGEIYVAKINAEMNITLLPSVERRGRWVDVKPAPDNLFCVTCSVCGDRQMIEVANYCPMCGARMEPVAPWYQVDGGKA